MTFVGKLCFLSKFGICPLKQIGFIHLVHADIGLSRLKNRHADGIDIVNAVENLQGTQSIQHHLRIPLCADLNTRAMLVIADVHHTVSDNDAVGSPETVLNPTGEIHPLFDQDYGVGASLLCGFEKFRHIGGISGGAVFHFFVVPGKIFDGVLSRNAKRLLESKLA